MISLVECWRRKNSPNWEYQDFASIKIFIGTSFGVKRFGIENRCLISSTSNFYLQDSYSTTVVPVLRHYLRQATPRKPPHYKHWRHENKNSWVTGWWQRDQKMEVNGIVKGLERYQGSALLSKSSVNLKSHLFRANKQTPRWSSCKLFWRKENVRVDCQEILLTNVTKRRWSLC